MPSVPLTSTLRDNLFEIEAQIRAAEVTADDARCRFEQSQREVQRLRQEERAVHFALQLLAEGLAVLPAGTRHAPVAG